VVIGLTSSLGNERFLAAGPGITITDYGANNPVRVSASLLAGPGIVLTQVGNAYAISSSIVDTTGFVSGSVVTSNDTATLLLSYAIGTNTLKDLNFQIVAKQNTFANYGRWQRNVLVGRSGSDVAFIHNSSSAAPISDIATDGSWGFNFLASGNNINVYVTGSISTVISWSCQFPPVSL